MTTARLGQTRLKGYATYLTVGDGDSPFDTSAECAAIVQANTGTAGYTLIWQRTIPAQQWVRFGSGSPNQQRNQGYMSMAIQDLGTDFEDGMLRLVVADANENRSHKVFEINTQRLHTVTPTTVITATPVDINEMIALPEQIDSPAAGEDSLLQLWFSTRIAGTTIDSVTFSIPATIYQKG